VVESSYTNACDIGSTPIYYQFVDDDSVDLRLSEAAVYEEQVMKTAGTVAVFKPTSMLQNGIFSAEFKVSTTTKASFGMQFRHHQDDRVVLNNYGWANDKIIIQYIPTDSAYDNDQVKWSHNVRNRFITELTHEQATVNSGTIQLSKFKVGPRGWNKLTVHVEDDKAWFYFNDELISELDIELPDSNKYYFTEWVAALYSSDSEDSIYYMRHPTVACID